MAQHKKKRITRKEILMRSMIVLLVLSLLFTGNIISLINVQLIKNDTFKAYASGEYTEYRVEYVIDESGDYCSERSADHNAYRHINDIAAGYELLEIRPKCTFLLCHLLFSPLRYLLNQLYNTMKIMSIFSAKFITILLIFHLCLVHPIEIY